MLFCIIHEMSHVAVGMALKMKVEKIEIMSFGLSVSFYKDLNDNIIKEILVALAGPLMSLALAILSCKIEFAFATIQENVYSNILIFLFNLIPIYPLDGGRIIKGILHIIFGSEKSEYLINKISKVTIIILTIISSIAVFYYKNIAIFLACILLWTLALKEKNDKTLAILQGK